MSKEKEILLSNIDANNWGRSKVISVFSLMESGFIVIDRLDFALLLRG